MSCERGKSHIWHVLMRWLDGNIFANMPANEVTGYKLRACAVELSYTCFLGFVCTWTHYSHVATPENKRGFMILMAAIMIGFITCFIRDSYVALKYWSVWTKPWKKESAQVIVIHDEPAKEFLPKRPHLRLINGGYLDDEQPPFGMHA